MPVISGANFQTPHGKGFLRYRRWTNYRQTHRVEFKYKYDSHTSSPFEQCLANPQQDQSISRMQWVLGWHGSTRYGFAVTYSGFSAGSFLYLGAAFTPSAGMGVLGMASQSRTQDSRRGHSYIQVRPSFPRLAWEYWVWWGLNLLKFPKSLLSSAGSFLYSGAAFTPSAGMSDYLIKIKSKQ